MSGAGAGWCWFAVLDGPAVDALAQAAAFAADGAPVGVLAAWAAGPRPVPHAVRCDSRVVDPGGLGGWVSLLVVPPGREPLFDDGAVSQAMRYVLRRPPARAVTTFTRDSSHFAGALTVTDRADDRALLDDPFARLHPARLLRVEVGLLGAASPPVGPVTQRYAGKPWPAAGFGR